MSRVPRVSQGEGSLQFVDLVLKTDISPFGHKMKRRDKFLETLYRMCKGEWWSVCILYYFHSKLKLKKDQVFSLIPTTTPSITDTVLDQKRLQI